MPIAWGTFQSNADEHFYLCNFYDFAEGLPEPKSFCKQLAKLHSKESPNGKFGFECVTYNGDLPQDNTWFDSWEEFFINGLRHILRLREERAGPNPELDAILPPLFETVIPRLLRPLESNGRRVKPSLVHGDLWCGNASVVKGTGEGVVYDPASFWAHNECTAIPSLESASLANGFWAIPQTSWEIGVLGEMVSPGRILKPTTHTSTDRNLLMITTIEMRCTPCK